MDYGQDNQDRLIAINAVHHANRYTSLDKSKKVHICITHVRSIEQSVVNIYHVISSPHNALPELP
jgi:hypothetical protein